MKHNFATLLLTIDLIGTFVFAFGRGDGRNREQA
jgi:hypothetical protein